MNVASLHAKGHPVSMLYYSTAEAMVLDAPLRNHDHQGGSRGRAEKNCFIDKRGKVWALDYDGGPPLSFSMPSFPRSPPLEECTLGVWGSSLSNVHCTVVIAAWHKLSPIYPNTSEIALLNFMKQSAYWQLLQACPVKAGTKDEFLLSAFGQPLLRLHSQRSFPWNAVRNVKNLDRDQGFYADRSKISSFLIRLRFETLQKQLEKGVNSTDSLNDMRKRVPTRSHSARLHLLCSPLCC